MNLKVGKGVFPQKHTLLQEALQNHIKQVKNRKCHPAADQGNHMLIIHYRIEYFSLNVSGFFFVVVVFILFIIHMRL